MRLFDKTIAIYNCVPQCVNIKVYSGCALEKHHTCALLSCFQPTADAVGQRFFNNAVQIYLDMNLSAQPVAGLKGS